MTNPLASAPDDALDDMLCFRTYALQRAFSRFYGEGFGDTGLTYPKYVVLKALSEGGPMSLGTLSSKVRSEPNTLSPMLKRMGSFGLVRRVRDPEDERRVLLSIEPYGADVLRAATATAEANWRALGLDPGDVAAAMRLMAAFRDRLDETTPPERLVLPPAPGA